MKKEIKTEIIIQETPERVWEVLTNFKGYSDWNPFIKSLEGKVKVGGKIIVRLESPGAKGMTFTPKVLTFDQNKEFKWIGRLFLPGIFDGEHRFELIDNGNGTTTFIQAERFNGILVRMLSGMLDGSTLNGFKAMNEQLKIESERRREHP
ncbi:SRPBCC domain-containing protein [Fluviicola chungangensis]|uniref:SRPBCC domain-containing protein n=1 Tax=Fluviicola chungangensis TaxID=2597671 RepID=A0A556N8A4_9FLAO|nr:SRPBCC domain-containing protein [Fluviicola chungangensis]TSJ48249.1 SRPBCC domain-containing protein [Fluviicola chungangensis]